MLASVVPAVWIEHLCERSGASVVPRPRDAFLEHVAVEGRMAGETEASLAVAAVARVLYRHVSEGELADVLAILPAKLRPLFQADP